MMQDRIEELIGRALNQSPMFVLGRSNQSTGMDHLGDLLPGDATTPRST